MNEYLVLALDGLIYAASYCLLVGLTAVCVRFFYRGHLRGVWVAAALSVLLVGIAKGFLDAQAGKWLPELDPYAQVAVGMGATVVLACGIVYWRFSSSFPSSAATGLVLVLAMYGVSFALPWVSERVLPPGMRVAQFIDSAYTRTQEARAAAANFKAVNDDAAALLAASLQALADLSSKENFEAVKTEFASGVKFYADRKAEWDAMSPEEREANRKAMAEFMAEQGLAADRYSLSALKNASMDDVKNLVAFMKEMQAENAAAGGAAPASAPVAAKVRPPAESMQILLRNIRGMTFSKEDHEAMATLSGIFFAKGIDTAIDETRTDLAMAKLNPEWAGTLLAAMMETKSGIPVALMINDEAPIVATPPPVIPSVPEPPVVRMVALPTKFGYVRVPKGTKDLDAISAAAETMPVTGFLAGGERVRVALGKKSLGLGEVYRVSMGARTFAFRIEEITDGQLYVSADFSE